ncbi:MAG: hypothetical protein MI756_05275, partial [Chromatiales bacterium]|nr:hypothetical protein [Chromatiales bacterium]
MQLPRTIELTTLRIVIAFFCTMSVSLSFAGPREQAKRIHDRLTGVPPTSAVVDSMAAKLSSGDGIGAAYEAMEHPAFYNTTVRELATPWTNRERSVYVDLNDTIATVVGMIRDDVPFDQVLYEDIVYVGTPAATAVAYSQSDNDHYLDLQLNRVDLGNPANLVQQRQSDLPNSPLGVNETAGVMTTRGFSEAFYVAGTNRSPLRFATLNFMCMDMEDFRDITAHPDRVRQDVTRSPGGGSNIFQNDCLTCHAGLDGLAGAFAYYDFDEDLQQTVYTAGAVQPKFLKDAGTFRFGFETESDAWINYWRTGPNAYVGWNAPG